MRILCIFLFSSLAELLVACASPQDTVVFVTNTSFGINAESKPPTASIAYDRVEGYVGPRTGSGSMPPVVASLQTGGNIFNPQIRQVYATGNAAILATQSPSQSSACKNDLSGSDNKLAFFGTATTYGLKVGFDESSGTPDSFVVGFKRNEVSVIPLAQASGGYVYPSVIGSIDTTVSTTSLKDTGLTIAQYFATGCPAEALAQNNPTVRAAFNNATTNVALASLTADQKAAVDKTLTDQKALVDKIVSAVAPAGVLDRGKLTALIQSANQSRPRTVNPDLGNVASADELRGHLADDFHASESLSQALDAQEQQRGGQNGS